MARFKAYSSDTGSSDEEEEKQIDVEIAEKQSSQVPSEVEARRAASEEYTSSSESSSEMDEHELISSLPRRRKKSESRSQGQNALVEDANGDIHYAHEINVRVSSASSSSQSPPARIRPVGDPTVIPWAQRVGVDAQKMHVMQTSLFRMEEEAAALKAANDSIKPRKNNIRLDVNSGSQVINRKHSRDSDGDGLRLDSREACLLLQSPRVRH